MTNWSGPQLNGDRTKFKFPYLEDLKRQLVATNTTNVASNVKKKTAHGEEESRRCI